MSSNPSTPIHSSFFYGQEAVPRTQSQTTNPLEDQPVHNTNIPYTQSSFSNSNTSFYQQNNSSTGSVSSIVSDVSDISPSSYSNLSRQSLNNFNNSSTNISRHQTPQHGLGTYHNNPSVYFSTESFPHYSNGPSFNNYNNQAGRSASQVGLLNESPATFDSSENLRNFTHSEKNGSPTQSRFPRMVLGASSIFFNTALNAAKLTTSTSFTNSKSHRKPTTNIPRPRNSKSQRRYARFTVYLIILFVVSIGVFAFHSYNTDKPTLSFLMESTAISPSAVGANDLQQNNGPWSVSYSPMNANGDCKHQGEIVRDLKDIRRAGFPAVKLYSPDCGVLEALNRVPKLDVVMGLYPYEYEDETAVTRTRMQRLLTSLNIQINELVQWNQWDRISTVVVGSSGVFEEQYSRRELVTMLTHIRRILKGDPKNTQDGERSTHSVYEGLGLDHIKITTAEPVQSYISQSRYNAGSAIEYRQSQQKSAKRIQEIALQLVQDKGQDESYKQIFSKASNQNEQKARDLFEDDVYYQSAITANDDDDLCSHVDVIGLVVQPYFSTTLSPLSAGKLVERDTKFARYLCSDQFIGAAYHHHVHPESDMKPANAKVEVNDSHLSVAILEAGWPSSGQNNGELAKVGIEEQRIALKSIVNAKDPYTNQKVPVALYSWNDEEWRHPGDLEVETHFGIKKQLYDNKKTSLFGFTF